MQTYPVQVTPSATPAPTSPTTLLYASKLGLALNCDLWTGLDKTTGLPAADDGPKIMAALAAASAHNPITLLMDGASLVSGLFLPVGGHWSIQGCGHDTGFFQQAGTNNDVIHNGPAGTSANSFIPPATRGMNVSIKDIFINGNRAANSTTGDLRGGIYPSPWFMGIVLMGLDHIAIEGVRFYNMSAYNLLLEDCGYWTVDNCHFENVLPTQAVVPQNSDGIHIDGPSNDGRISKCFFRTGDDAIALNAPEGQVGPRGMSIVRTTIDDCLASQAQLMMRIYSDSTGISAVDGVTVTNYQGTPNVMGFLLGVESVRTMTQPDAITNISFVNCKVVGRTFCVIQDNIGVLSFDTCDWVGGTVTQAMLTGCSVPSVVSSLTISNCRMVRTPSGNSGQGLLDNADLFGNGGSNAITWRRVNVNGFGVVDAGGFSGSPIAGLISLAGGATVGEMHIADVDAGNIAALLSSGSTASISSVSGGAVLQTGWEIPDAIAAKWTPYVSATSHIPSYKNAAGTVISL